MYDAGTVVSGVSKPTFSFSMLTKTIAQSDVDTVHADEEATMLRWREFGAVGRGWSRQYSCLPPLRIGQHLLTAKNPHDPAPAIKRATMNIATLTEPQSKAPPTIENAAQ